MTKLTDIKLTLVGLPEGKDRAQFIDLELPENKDFKPPGKSKPQGAIVITDYGENDLVVYFKLYYYQTNNDPEVIGLKVVGVYTLDEITKGKK